MHAALASFESTDKRTTELLRQTAESTHSRDCLTVSAESSMRKRQFGHLLSGSLLALIFITPIHAAAISEPLGPAAQPPSATPAPAAPGDACIKNEVDEHPAAIRSEERRVG